jgi:hypothetical protein
MEVTLIIIVGVLFVLAAIVGVKGRRGRRATREQDQAKGDVRAREGEAQQERSQARKSIPRPTSRVTRR